MSESPNNKSPFRKNTAERLEKTPEGRALKSLIDRHGFGGLADKLEVPRALVRHWVHNGKVGRGAARMIEDRLDIPKSTMRPDVVPDEWDKGDRGIQPATSPREGTNHAPVIDALTEDLKCSRADLGAYLGIAPSSVNQWRSRDRIPTWAILRLATDETIPLSGKARKMVRKLIAA